MTNVLQKHDPTVNPENLGYYKQIVIVGYKQNTIKLCNVLESAYLSRQTAR